MKEIRNWQLNNERPFHVMALEQSDRATKPHIHDCFQISYCYEGSGVCTVEGKIFPFSPGSVYVVTPNEYHFLQSTKGRISKWRFFYVSPSCLLNNLIVEPSMMDTTTFWGPNFQNVLSRKEQHELSRLVELMFNEIEKKKANWRSAISGLFYTILIVLRRLPNQERVDPSKQTAMARVAEAIYDISINYARPLSVAYLAKKCNMSSSTFDRVFRKATGIAPCQYLLRYRVYRASDLILNSGQGILEASHNVGFGNPSSFYRQFKKTFGCSPAKWTKLLSRRGEKA